MTGSKKLQNIVIYQSPNGAVEVRVDQHQETIKLTQQQVGQLFNVQKAAISKHVKNIFDTGELDKNSTVSILETVQTEGKRRIKRKIEYYNLDLILSIGYRVNSINATKFRQWVTKTLRQHIIKGYTINKKRIAKNYQEFLKAVKSVQKLLPTNGQVPAMDALELIKIFANTWLSLEAYDKSALPQAGDSKKRIKIAADELAQALLELKQKLVNSKQASDLFGQEKSRGAVSGIVGNVFSICFRSRCLQDTGGKSGTPFVFFCQKSSLH